MLNVHRNHKNGGKGYGGGGRGRLYTYRHTVTTRMTCIKMGSDESDFNVSLIVRDKEVGEEGDYIPIATLSQPE